MTAPAVSICMPAFNAAKWIAAAIESALAQTYEDFELVVADNASSDETVAIVRSFGDPRIRVETAERTIGAVANHNRAVRLAGGEYVKFLHADDLLLPDCIEAMAGLAREDPRIGLVFAARDVIVEEPEGRDWAARFARPHERLHGLVRVTEGRALLGQLLDAGVEENWIGEPSAVLLTRACLAGVGLLNTRLHQIADLELWLRIMATHRVGFIERPLSVYRHHGQSGTALNARVGRDWLDRLWLLEGLLATDALAEERERLERLRREALRRAVRAQAGRILRRRWTRDLLDYGTYRALALAGRRPPLHEPLTDPATSRSGQGQSP